MEESGIEITPPVSPMPASDSPPPPNTSKTSAVVQDRPPLLLVKVHFYTVVLVKPRCFLHRCQLCRSPSRNSHALIYIIYMHAYIYTYPNRQRKGKYDEVIFVLVVPGLSTVGSSSVSMSGPVPSAALTPKMTPFIPPTLTPPPSAVTPPPPSGPAAPDVPSTFSSPSSLPSSPYSSVLQPSPAPLHPPVVSSVRPPPPGPPTGPPVSSFSLSAGYDITRGHAGRTPQTPLMPTFPASTALPGEHHRLRLH